MGSHLDIDFSPIFFDLGGQNGAKLDGKSIKNLSKKVFKNRCEKVAVLAASWAHFGHGIRAAVPRRSPPPSSLSVEG